MKHTSFCQAYTREWADGRLLTWNEWLDVSSRQEVILHRIGGPAFIFDSGAMVWCVNGERHRLDGPAIIGSRGTKIWFVNNKKHRLDGPAYEGANGTKEWWVNGKRLDAEEVKNWLVENNINLKTKEGQMAFQLRWG